jgi:predicted HicB family RNase H-like nuclease
MPATKAQQRAVNKYVKKNYDEVKFRVPKGKKNAIQQYAAAHNESVNAFLNRVVDETMQRDQES